LAGTLAYVDVGPVSFKGYIMRDFDYRTSLLLDRAVIGSEAGSRFWRIVKRLLYWWIG